MKAIKGHMSENRFDYQFAIPVLRIPGIFEITDTSFRAIKGMYKLKTILISRDP